jgi:deazaflavin-dependent oxidoreductase (nitroreductase family)
MAELADLPFCYLTTRGRVSGRPHRIEIWFALREGTAFLLSGGRDRSDWVRNLIADPEVELEIGGETRRTTARIVEAETEEDALARRLLVEKYRTSVDDLASWGRTSLPVAIAWT